MSRMRFVMSLCLVLLLSHSALACSNFMATDGSRVLFGDSEDGGHGHPLIENPETAAVFFKPRLPGEHGRLHFGWVLEGKYASYQAGMNERGLAYGLTSVPDTPLDPHPERPYSFSDTPYFDRLLALLETVDEVIEHTMEYSADRLWFQAMFVDAKGDAVVVGPGPDGDFAFTRRSLDEPLCVAISSVNVADPPRFPWKDAVRRDVDATTLLAQAVESGTLGLDTFADALDAVHRQGAIAAGGSYTMYSTTYDLTHQVAHVYYMSQFDEVAEIDLAEELRRGSEVLLLTDLFTEDLKGRAYDQFRDMKQTGIVLLTLEIAAVIALLGAAAVWLGSLVLGST
jgi:hypothetical protein